MKKDIKLKGQLKLYMLAGNYDSFPYPDEYLDLQDGSKGRAAYECVCAGLCSRHWHYVFLQ